MRPDDTSLSKPHTLRDCGVRPDPDIGLDSSGRIHRWFVNHWDRQIAIIVIEGNGDAVWGDHGFVADAYPYG
jgi:hypothetical protein